MGVKMKEKKVALLIETSWAYGRGLLQGVANYHRENRSNWSMFVEPSGLSDRPPHWFDRLNGDGILARISDRQTADMLLGLGIPVIELRGIVSDIDIPFVGVDHRSVASLAFEHFRDRGFRRFGMVSAPPGYISHLDERCVHFNSLVNESGFTCRVFQDTRFGNPKMGWELEQQKISSYLLSLELPVAILCANDITARETIEACRLAGLSVPDQVAVMGVNNDQYLCTLSTPPISSVDVDAAAIGYTAAKLLEKMMKGKSDPAVPEQTLVPSKEVVVRASTDIFAIDDPVVAESLRYIGNEACSDIVAQSPVCRSLLERRFRKSLGRSIHREILRVRLEKACGLLRSTDFGLDPIAEYAGFKSAVYLSQVFRRELGVTPGKWRQEHSCSGSGVQD